MLVVPETNTISPAFSKRKNTNLQTQNEMQKWILFMKKSRQTSKFLKFSKYNLSKKGGNNNIVFR